MVEVTHHDVRRSGQTVREGSRPGPIVIIPIAEIRSGYRNRAGALGQSGQRIGRLKQLACLLVGPKLVIRILCQDFVDLHPTLGQRVGVFNQDVRL